MLRVTFQTSLTAPKILATAGDEGKVGVCLGFRVPGPDGFKKRFWAWHEYAKEAPTDTLQPLGSFCLRLPRASGINVHKHLRRNAELSAAAAK